MTIRSLLRRLRRGSPPRAATETGTMWTRIVMDRETHRFVSRLPFRELDALEVSGTKWKDFGFRSYRSAAYPQLDLCAAPLAERFDVLVAEQVLEHVQWPYRAVRHAFEMLRPGGLFVVTTPFLIRVHEEPIDCSRWTERGLKHLLAEGGFPMESIETGAWGNRECLIANLSHWEEYRPGAHSLENDPAFPTVVWAFARRPKAQ